MNLIKIFNNKKYIKFMKNISWNILNTFIFSYKFKFEINILKYKKIEYLKQTIFNFNIL